MDSIMIQLVVRGIRQSYSVSGDLQACDDTAFAIQLASGKSVAFPHSAMERVETVLLPEWLDTLLAELARCKTRDHYLGLAESIPPGTPQWLFDSFQKWLQAETVWMKRSRYHQASTARQAAIEAQKVIESTAGRLLNHAPKFKQSLAASKNSLSALWNEHAEGIQPKPYIIAPGHTLRVDRQTGGEFQLPLRVKLDTTEDAATNIQLHLENFRGLEVLGARPRIEILKSGSSQVTYTRMIDRRRQGAKGDLKVQAHLSYETPDGRTRNSPRQSVTFSLVSSREELESIPNPFKEYSSGIPIENETMFFGRTSLVRDICDLLSQGRPGKAYALYGQKRSGKSSVLEAVRAQLTRQGVLVASLSMGTIDRSALTVGFAESILDQLRIRVDELLPLRVSQRLLDRWPDGQSIADRPLRAMQTGMTAARALIRQGNMPEPSLVVLIDEITYLYEVFRRPHFDEQEAAGIRDFLRQFKGLLEARLFSAFLVGQDTMPHFLAAFPNEMSVVRVERLEYLTPEETERLADEPIRTPGNASRFTGYALNTLASYTSGQPFLAQILCDRVVTLANEGRLRTISEADVEGAVESLLSGPRQLPPHVFDCFLTADNTGVQLDTLNREVRESLPQVLPGHIWDVLADISNRPGHDSAGVALDEFLADPLSRQVIKDLVSRRVLTESNGRAKIRVPLFREYLRRNS